MKADRLTLLAYTLKDVLSKSSEARQMYSLIEQQNLTLTLDDSNRQFTVFAPINSALDQLSATRHRDNDYRLLASRHIITSAVTRQDVQEEEQFETVSKEKARVMKYSSRVSAIIVRNIY